ncbi:hypothetical protein M2444_004787 [Paenibacillus sp. PastF-3]|uniref:hypothetical protein n=1 Tax=Paenibacillus sp. PastF-3 TaxID=2940626 RepID=UPI002473E741|nr:hypothetical protein [Paenibacillus sp. PastF-3]MDH6372958.1 hypothetical protein [Paenibacillus sp. PastF-3]
MKLSLRGICVLRVLFLAAVYSVFQSFLSNPNDKKLFFFVIVMISIMGYAMDRNRQKDSNISTNRLTKVKEASNIPHCKPAMEEKYKCLSYTELKWIGKELQRNQQHTQIKGSYYFVICVLLVFTWMQGLLEAGGEVNVGLRILIPGCFILFLAILVIRIYIHQRQLDKENLVIESITSKSEIKRRLSKYAN